MRRLILVLALAMPGAAVASDGVIDTPSEETAKKDAKYHDLHRTDPPREYGEVSPTTKRRAKKAVNWPGNLGEQYGLEGNVSTKGQTHDEKVGRVPPSDAKH
jgi:hypothetical protein